MLEMMKRHREWWVISGCLRLEVLVAVGSGSLYLGWLVMLVVIGDDLRPYGFGGMIYILTGLLDNSIYYVQLVK